MERKNLKIGLFGFGVVGQGLYEVLLQSPRLKAVIGKICIRDSRKERSLDQTLFTVDRDVILNDPSINVVVELIDDSDAAYEIVSASLKKGKAVVSANKKMIAHHFDELCELQRKHDVPLLYEAACCASIPIIRNLEEYYDNDLLEYIEGIVNGSTNYILTKVFSENKSYPEALKEAQEKGYAESDPILDTGGFDAKYKLVIMIAHAFGIVANPEEVFNCGINSIGDLELNYAREKGLKIKLIAQAYKSPTGIISCMVMPKFVDKHSILYGVDDVFNGIITRTTFSDRQFFVGKGAGAYPTASAVLADISALSYDYRYEYKKLTQHPDCELEANPRLKMFLRHSKKDAEALKACFDDVAESYLNHNAGYIIGDISLDRVKEISANYSDDVSFVLFERISNAVL